MLYAKTKSFINYIYETAQNRTLYLSECEEYKDPKVKEYYDNLCKQREKPLAKVLYSLLNVEALQFHCYTEPNGDIVFTKNRRTKEDYDEEGKPLYSEDDITKRRNQQTNSSGCMSVIIVFVITTLLFFLV